MPAWAEVAALVALAVAANAEIFRLGFFADDFHFLDIARRIPLFDALSGQYGIYPWYRPLSRELYFALVTLAGPAGAIVARALSLAAVAGCVVLLDRLGRELVGARAARIGAVLFASYEFTRFLAAWASGFQDLLALLLVLAALDALLRERTRAALLFAGLAPFAKETAFVVFPLLALAALRPGAPKRRVPLFLALSGVALAAALLHFVARASWKSGGTSARIDFEPGAWTGVLGELAGGFAGRAAVLEPAALSLALLAAVAAFAALTRPSPQGEATPGRAGLAYVAAAALVGVLPLAAGQWLRLSATHAYYGFAAAPWLALLAGAALAAVRPAGIATALLVALTGWNVLALGYRAPDLGIQSGWNFVRWDWREAVRLSAISARLGEDLRTELSARPESLVIGYTGMPAGSFFQTEDGPAARVSLGDRTVRSYWINDAPYHQARHPAALLRFHPVSLHLERVDLSVEPFDAAAGLAVAMGQPGPAAMFAAMSGPPQLRSLEMNYFRAAAALIAEGPDAFARELILAGLIDSAGAGPRERAQRLLGMNPELATAYEAVLRRPLNSDARAAMAAEFEARGAWISAAVEMRIALALAPRPVSDLARLATILERTNDLRAARAAWLRVREAAPGGEWEARARERMAALDRLGAAKPPPTPRRALGRAIGGGAALDTTRGIPDPRALP